MKNKHLNLKHSINYKISILILGIIILSISTIFSQTINKNYIDGELYVKIKDDYKKDFDFKSKSPNIDIKNFPFLDAARKKHNLKIKSSFYFAKSEKLRRILRISANDFAEIEQIIRELELLKEVEYAEKVPLNRTSLTPNDLGNNTYSGQWGLHKIQAQNAWNITAGNPNIVVAVVDNAFETAHPDLAGNLVTGRDVSDNDNNPNPPNANFDHGTHVAGTVASSTNNGIGIASIGYNVSIMPIKATPDNGSPSSIFHGYEGITWAADNGADIINMSWGGSGYSSTEQNIINNAASQGAVLVAAAGNSNSSSTHYPAGYNNVISVAATDINDNKASFSNYGSWVDISAPGVNIKSTVPFGSYGNKSGTSMASPLVAGLCGLVLSANPSLSPAQVESCLKTSADPISSYSGNLGAGRINAYKTAQCASGGNTPCASTVTSFPYNEGFESGFGAWTQDTGDNINWTRKSGSTPSGGTGPSSASQGAYYMYTESSGSGNGFPNKVANLISPCFNLSLVSNPMLVFKYHMYGSTMGTLRVQVSTNNGSTWTTLWTKTGNQGNSWQTANVSLNSYTSQTALKIRFNGTTGSSYTSDMAIDDVSLSSSGSGGCTLSTSPSSSVLLSNLASNESVYVYSTSNWTASDNVSWITLNTTSGNGNGNLSFSVSTNTSTSSRAGTITITCGSSSTTVLVTQAGTPTSSCSSTITSFPYTESFESANTPWSPITTSTSCTGTWTRKSGSTTSSSTGPSSAQAGSYYLYTESSSGCSNRTMILEGPCFNLSLVSNPMLVFKYHMYGSTMGTLRVQVSTNNGSTWNTLWTRTGNQGNSWQTANVNLNSYTSQSNLKIRFNGTTGTSYTSDMAIDDVSLAGLSAPQPDLIIQSKSLSTSSIACGSSLTAYATVKNNGTASAGYSYLGYYLSTNTTFDNNDTYLSQDYVGSLGAGSSGNESQPLTIPTGLAAGTYYILFVADRNSNVSESNENNNVAYQAITITCGGGNSNFNCFDFSNDTQGWVIGGTISDQCVPCGGGWLVFADGTNPANDPMIISGDLNFSGNDVNALYANLWTELPGGFQLFWETSDEPYFSQDKSVIVSVSSNNVIVQFNLANHAKWSNKVITKLRLDPPGNGRHTRFYSICDTPQNLFNNTSEDTDGAVADSNTPDTDNYNRVENQPANVDIRNYPNPFTQQTTIEFTLEKDVPVTLFVSDLTGKQIAVLLDDEQKLKGTHQAIFDGNNYLAGMYYYTIQAGNYVSTQKMTLVK